MAWLIILGAMALLVGGIAFLRPSPRERQQAQLRGQALQAGLGVKLKRLQRPGQLEAESLAVYSLARSPAQLERFRAHPAAFLAVRAADGGLDRIGEEWQFLESDAGARALNGALADLTAGLPADIVGLSSGPGGVGVYWNERVGAVSVAELGDLLRKLSELTTP